MHGHKMGHKYIKVFNTPPSPYTFLLSKYVHLSLPLHLHPTIEIRNEWGEAQKVSAFKQ